MLSVSRKCRINGIQPEMIWAQVIVAQAAMGTAHDVVITHCRDGEHSEKSLHYVGYAIDVVLTGVPVEEGIDKFELDLKLGLTPEFDIVKHWDGDRFTHFHIEFQPKGSTQGRVLV